VAGVLGEWSEQHRPWAVLASGTVSGREVCSRMAMRLAAGMTGDAVEVEVSPAGQLAAWKPAFGGRMLAAITASSTIQVVTMRPGAGQLHTPRPVLRPAPVTQLPAEGKGQVQVLATSAVDQVDRLLAARVVVGVGQGVDPAGYELVRMLCGTLGAEMAVTRKVTDKGWAPHSRQVGITGLALAPDLYVAIGLAGKPNHMLGVRNARQVLAINQDPAAPVFDEADVGVVAPWRAVVPLLVEQLVAQGLGVGAVEQTGVSRAAIQH
jgi:electron transfer flavoprotein alpha subunit